jgi:hypothetical protein
MVTGDGGGYSSCEYWCLSRRDFATAFAIAATLRARGDRRSTPGGSYPGCRRLDDDAEARVCKLVDAARQIRALDDALAATKPVREGSARTVGEARALDAGRREQQRAPRVQRRLRRATGKHHLPTARSRVPINSEVATAAAAAAAVARGRGVRHTSDALKKRSVGIQIGQFSV